MKVSDAITKSWKPNPDNITFRVSADELPAGAIRRARDFAIKVDEHYWNVEQIGGTLWGIYTDIDDKPKLFALYVDEGEPAKTEETARARYLTMLHHTKGRGE